MSELNTEKVLTLMVAGGGTGGHIYPAVAIAREFMARDARRKVVFVGTEYGLEKTLVPREGFPLEFVSIGGLKGKSILLTLRNAARIPWSLVEAWRLLSKHRPDVVLGVGGYASGPVVLAAALRRIPTAVHESNAFPGLTNRLLARVSSEVLVGYAPALEQFRSRGVITGNPIRAEFFTASPRAAVASKIRMLVFGGSQGSRIVNEAVTGSLLFLAHLRDRLEIVHQTGKTDLDKVQQAYRSSAFATARVVPFLDGMASEMSAADLIVCRSGAMTVGELTAVGRGSILVPFALATNNHQEMNARVLEQHGAARVVTERDLTPERLAAAIGELVSDQARLASMGSRAKELATPDATKNIADILERLTRNELH